MWTQLAILGACVLGTTARFQTPFGSGGHLPAHVHAAHRPTPKYGSAGLGESFTRLAASDIDTAAINAFARQDISSLSQDDFTTLTHPAYPRHGLRLKKSRFCDGKVDAYTGYIDVEARHLFFYFFKSRGDWTKDDVIFWTNGGPGCSSSIGLFMELGPCRITDATKGPEPFEYGWNEHANVIFVDQPIGVGFSYADHGETVSTSEDAAIDVAFLSAAFFEHFHQLQGNAFHMAGESYGGRYIPLFASAVHDLNPRLEKAGFAPVNLSSIMVGNGITDFVTMATSFYDMMCTPASLDPILDISSCVRMKQAAPRCEKMMKAACVDVFDAMGCEAAKAFCGAELELPFLTTGLNGYDMSKPCEGEPDALCYPVTKQIAGWLARNDTRAALGVDAAVPAGFASCSSEVFAGFISTDDELNPTQLWVAGLLERGVRALIYVGEYDWICNWVGNARWVHALEWSGGDGFRAEEETTWEMDGQVKGRKRASGPLTFLTIRGAGHMVPYDKPKEASEMVRRWIKQQAF